ncbi:hypothetical protein [Flaviaesturariibacter terrae]
MILASCGGGERNYTQGSDILYYPERNLYFDKSNNRYLAFDTVEQQWRQEAPEAVGAPGTLGPAVPIEHPAVPVYRDNAQHRLVYGTVRYTDRTELARKRVEDSLAASRPPAAAPEPVPGEAPKKKSKLGRWLQKIFGKNKDE